MLIPNETLWESDHILMVQNTADWSKDDASLMADCVLKLIKSRLEDAIATGNEAILIIDLAGGNFPPWGEVLRIVKFFVTMRSLLISGLTCTVIHADTNYQKTWIDRVLKLFPHAKPVHVVRSKTLIKEVIGTYRKPVEVQEV